MNDRRSSHHHHTRQTFEEKYRALENELKRKNDTIESLRNEFNDTSHHQNDLSRSSIDQSVGVLLLLHSKRIPSGSFKFVRNGSQRSSATSSNWHVLVSITDLSYDDQRFLSLDQRS